MSNDENVHVSFIDASFTKPDIGLRSDPENLDEIPDMKPGNHFLNATFAKPPYMKQDMWSDPDEIPDMTDDSDFENKEIDHFNDFRKQYGYVSSPGTFRLAEKYGHGTTKSQDGPKDMGK